MFAFLEGVLVLACAAALLTAAFWRGQRANSIAVIFGLSLLGGLLQELRLKVDPAYAAEKAAQAERMRVEEERARAHQVAANVLVAIERRKAEEFAAFQREMTERQSRLDRLREEERQRNAQKLAELERLELLPIELPSRQREEATGNQAEIVASIIAQSRAGYRGNCGCPDDRDRTGRRCGRRSAYSRAGGATVICYERDVTAEMIAAASGMAQISEGQETEIPRSLSDGGRYFLIEMKQEGDLINALHKRVSAYSVDWSRVEINCSKSLMRSLGDSDVGPTSIKIRPTNWFPLVPGSSKSDLFNFVCGS
jgi:hypothetical protein